MMLIHPKQETIVFSVGWVDGGSLWILQPKSKEVSRFKLSDAKHLSLHRGDDWHFAVFHHYDGGKFEISGHHFSDPPTPISRVLYSGTEAKVVGDASVWIRLPSHYRCYLSNERVREFVLVSIENGGVSVHTPDWYNDTYDKDYQGLTDVEPVPNTHLLLCSVQRSSTLILYDPSLRVVVREVRLADRGGNPKLLLRKSKPEVWTVDYDTLCVVSTDDWMAKRQVLLRGGSEHMHRQFAGDFHFSEDERRLFVSRPFSGDALALDTDSLKLVGRAALGAQPLDLAILSNSDVFARDWKTGSLLAGQMLTE